MSQNDWKLAQSRTIEDSDPRAYEAYTFRREVDGDITRIIFVAQPNEDRTGTYYSMLIDSTIVCDGDLRIDGYKLEGWAGEEHILRKEVKPDTFIGRDIMTMKFIDINPQLVRRITTSQIVGIALNDCEHDYIIFPEGLKLIMGECLLRHEGGKELDDKLKAAICKFAESQEPLEAEFAEILHKNLWELYQE